MLVLTRRTGQKIILDNQITVTVLETRGDTVKIGIEAPKHIPIYREEIYHEIMQANRQATTPVQPTELDQAAQLAESAKRSSKTLQPPSVSPTP